MGKVGMNRLRTANAADSAALAGASALAAVANNIAYINDGPIAQALKWRALAFEGALMSTWFLCGHPLCNANVTCPIQRIDYNMYKAYVGQLLLDYLFLMKTSKDGFEMARAQTHRTVFGNAGIEEAQRRRRDPVTGFFTSEILQPRLSRWLNKHAVTDPDLPSPGDMRGREYTFKWYGYSIDTDSQSRTFGKEVKESELNEVTSRVEISDCAYALRNMPFMPFFKEYKFHVTAVTPSGKHCAPCKCKWTKECFKNDRIAFQEWATEVQKQGMEARWYFIGMIMANNIAPLLFGCSPQADIESIIAAVMAACATPVVFMPTVPPKKQCVCGPCGASVHCCKDACPPVCVPGGGWPPTNAIPAPKPAKATVMYIVPVPWIEDITNDDRIRVTVRVSRTEPAKEMGFWRRRRATVTSEATARVTSRGFCYGCYDAELESVR
jgi:hypothetical protein